jgi:hypothetical protein
MRSVWPIGFLMRKLCGCVVGLLGILLLGQAALAEREGAAKVPLVAEKMAQNNAEQASVPGRDVLVAGAGAVIDGKSRTLFTIDVGTQAVPARPKLELLLAPSEVVPNEPYLIVISLEQSGGNDAKRLGTASFYPARSGVVQAFYIDASAIIAEMKAKGTTRADLSVSLAPVERTQTLTSSKVRLVGVRIVGS